MPHPALELAFAALLFAESGQEPAESEKTEEERPEQEPPFTDAQLDYLEDMRYRILEEGARAAGAPAAAPSALEIRAEAYMKWLYRNNASQGCVTYGNPHPLGDNYSGDNGACPEFAITLIGRPLPEIEGGFRLQTRYGQQFADWFENGDRRQVPDASSESLGQNHSAHVQLRGIYVRVAEPLPLVDWFLAGSSDLAYFDAWTVGKVRFTERFNAKGLFLQTSAGEWAKLLVARIALSKLFGTANYNSIEEPLVTNPFWARDAIYAASVATQPAMMEKLTLTINAALVLDEEADARDPDAPGSVNTLDPRDEVTSVAPRFLGVNASLAADLHGFDAFKARGLVAISHNRPSADYVTNLALGGLGFSNVVYADVSDIAGTLRFELPDLLFEGVVAKLEYFNIGADYNAIVGSRREDDVLLTDGFFDGGQLPTLNLANELADFNDRFYETAIGWHGGTVVLEQLGDFADLTAEGTFITYNTNLQDRDMDVYPGFGGFTGYTDTQLFSYANTNDRGRDPRAVYARDQDRRSVIAMLRVKLKPDLWPGSTIILKGKYILDRDGRALEVEEDDYAASLFMGDASIGAKPLERLTLALGFAGDYWIEDGRSGTYAGGRPSFLDYRTLRLRPYLDVRYSLGALSAAYHLEALKKDADASDEDQSFTTALIWRSVGWLSVQF